MATKFPDKSQTSWDLAEDLELPRTSPPKFQKTRFNPRVRKILVRDSGAGDGCANFTAPGKIAFFLKENLHVHKVPRFRGGISGFSGGGGDSISWARGFF